MEKAVQLVQRSASLGIRDLIDLFSLSVFPSSFETHKHPLTSSCRMATWYFMHFHFLFYVFDGLTLRRSTFLCSWCPSRQTRRAVFLPARPQIGGDSFRRDSWTWPGPSMKAAAGVSTTGLRDVLWLWLTWQMVELRLNQHVSHVHQRREDPSTHTFLSCFLCLFSRGCLGVLCVLICVFDTS